MFSFFLLFSFIVDVLGMIEVLQLMQGGYPSRAQFVDLYQM